MKNGDLTYEEALAELGQILQDLQGEQTSIEQLTQRSERAGQLIQYCRTKLRDVETKLAQVAETPIL